MILHVLFSHHRLDFYGPTWWALYRDITQTDRTERTCREDYKYSHGKERTKMYPMRVLKPYAKYNAEERAAYDKAFQDVIDSAKRQGITITGSAEGEDGEEEKEDEDEDEDMDGEAEDEVDAEAEVAEAKEVENVEEHRDEADENEDELDVGRKYNVNEDIEMEDAEDEYATAQEDGSDSDDSSQNHATANEDAAARKDESVNKFKMPDFPDNTLWDQQNPDMLAKADFAAIGNARAVLSAAIGAHEMSRKNADVSSIPAILASRAYPFPAHLETVAKFNPAIAAGLASARPAVVPGSAANTSNSTATSSGVPQKYGRRHPKQLKVEIEDAPAVAVEGPKRGGCRSKNQLAPVGDFDNFMNAYLSGALGERSEEETKVYEHDLGKKTKDNTVKNRKSLSDLGGPLETMETPDMTSLKPSRKRVGFDRVTFHGGKSKKPAHRAQLTTDKPSESSTRDQDQIIRNLKLATPEVALSPLQATQEAPTLGTHPICGEEYDIWCRENLDRILFDEPFNMFPNRIIVPGSRRTAPENPLSAEERATNFFFDMFDGKLPKSTLR